MAADRYARDEFTGRLERREEAEYEARLPGMIIEAYYDQRARRLARDRLDAEERPPFELEGPLTLRERLARPREDPRWRVEGWLPAQGRAVFAAQAKAGKTTTVVSLVRSLVDAVPFLGRDAVQQVTGRVLVIDFEMTEHQLDDWYGAAGLLAQERVLVMPMRGQAHGFDLRDEDLRRRWSDLLVENEVEVVIWDCLRPVMDALGLDENHDAGLLLTAFDAMLRDANSPEAVIVHHMGHTSERARGDSRIVGWGDANWKLVVDEEAGDHGDRFISAYGRTVDQRETKLQRDPETGLLSIVGGNRQDARGAAAAAAVVAVLGAAEEPLTAGAVETLVMAHGVSRARARDALAQLVALNQVHAEVGERNARLHRLSESSSPVRRSSPEPASEVARQFAAAYIGRRGGEVEAEEEEDQFAAASSGDLTDEQRALLEEIHSRGKEGTS